MSAVVLVEGGSDRLALEELAARRGRDLRAEGVAVVAMNGITNVGRYLGEYGKGAARIAGLYDAGAEAHLRRRLQRAGFGPASSRADMEALGFFACVADLEDELIRAVGASAVERIMEAEGDLRSFRIMQRQGAGPRPAGGRSGTPPQPCACLQRG